MTTASPGSAYVLGTTEAEHERLMRQAARVDPFTERLFRDAGIGPGQRVLDVGSGVGDVAMLAARLVGSSGEVVGVERDAGTIAKARARVTGAGLRNVTFLQADATHLPSGQAFDAAVGRFILQFLPNPTAVVRSLAAVVRPSGVLAFHEVAWTQSLQLLAHLPLTFACASLVREAIRRSGAMPDMELILYRAFVDAGLPPPTMRVEVPIGVDADSTRWIHDLFCTVRPQLAQYGLSHEPVGDPDTLLPRLLAEFAAAKSFGAYLGLVGASSRRPPTLAG
jgi:SAM-dependent methyltransferase